MRGNLSERPYSSLWPFCRMVADSSETGRLVELDGVIAAIVPAAPGRSVVNCVAYDSPAALERALSPVGEAYDRARVRAWTVWVPEDDDVGQRILHESGHQLDAAPRAMALALDQFDRAPSGEVEVDREPAAADVGRINDAAYGFDGDFSRAFTHRPETLHLYGARLEGETVACVGSIHHAGDCGIFLVATHPAARGRGLASELMVAALADARAAGCESASLQSTTMGRPVYARLGFREFGTIQMWERRESAST
jgi:GNAT superfamily N-acetyltransferase